MPIAEKTFSRERIHAAILWTALAFAFLCGTWLRFKLDTLPASTADTWGFLKPAISALYGGSFETVFGRPFIYPAFLYAVIGIFGDFRAIAVLQHIAGIMAGGILLLALLKLKNRMGSLMAVVLAEAAFVCVITAFLTNNWQATLEHMIVSEAMMPFFCATVLLCFTGIAASIKTGNTFEWGIGIIAAGAVAAMYQPRFLPIFCLCAACGIYAVRVSNVLRGVATRSAAFTGVALLSLWLAGQYFSHNDLFAKTTPGDVLFSANARIVSSVMDDELRNPSCGDREFLARLSEELKAPVIPGYLQWRGACRTVAAHFNYDGGKARSFEIRWFMKAVMHHPWQYIADVLGRLRNLYGWDMRMLTMRPSRGNGLPLAFAMGMGANQWRPLHGGWYYGARELVHPWWRDSTDSFWIAQNDSLLRLLAAPGPLNCYLAGLKTAVTGKNPDGEDVRIGGIAGGIFEKVLFFNVAFFVPGLAAALLMAGILTWRHKWDRDLVFLASLSAFSHICVLSSALFGAVVFTFDDLRYFLDSALFMYAAHYCGLAFSTLAAMRFR